MRWRTTDGCTGIIIVPGQRESLCTRTVAGSVTTRPVNDRNGRYYIAVELWRAAMDAARPRTRYSMQHAVYVDGRVAVGGRLRQPQTAWAWYKAVDTWAVVARAKTPMRSAAARVRPSDIHGHSLPLDLTTVVLPPRRKRQARRMRRGRRPELVFEVPAGAHVAGFAFHHTRLRRQLPKRIQPPDRATDPPPARSDLTSSRSGLTYLTL